jgi:hypothetical protein
MRRLARRARDDRGSSWAAALVLILSVPAAAQQPELRVGPDLPVGLTPEGKLMIEPHLAAHPSDPNRLLAVGMATDPDYSEEYCLVFGSLDGGETWSQQRPSGIGCGDPWLTLTEERAILTALGTHPDLPDNGNQLLTFFSPDGGSTWPSVPQSLGRGHDGPRSLAAMDGTVYVTSGEGWTDSSAKRRWGLFLGRAARATAHVVTQTGRYLPSNLNQNMDGAAILSNGVLILTYQDFQRPVGGEERAFRGRDGALETRRVWAIASPDQGESFPPPMLVTEACYARPTFLAVDTTNGPYRDRIYHVCPGDQLKSVLVTSSADHGWEWTDAAPIEAPAETFGSRNFPVIAVNNEGVVAVAWMDRRDDPSGDCYVPYLAASADGGATFANAVRIATAVSCPDATRTGQAGSRFRTGGDYFGLVSTADGRFHVLWPDARDGVFKLRTAAITVANPGR